MKDKEKQIEEIENMIDDYLQGLMGGSELTLAKKIYEKILPEDSVVLSREEYEKLKKYEYKVQCGVCFTQKEWFDFINEDSNFRTSLQIKAEEKGYEQARKEMLKDCIESNKIAEQIGYEKGSKETAEKILNELVGHTFEDDGWTWTVSKEDIQWLADKYNVEIKE